MEMVKRSVFARVREQGEMNKQSPEDFKGVKILLCSCNNGFL